MTREGRGKPETEERLVAAAVQLFSKKWYGTVSVAEICRQASLSNGVFYRYYGGKEALFVEVARLSDAYDGIGEEVVHQARTATEVYFGEATQMRAKAGGLLDALVTGIDGTETAVVASVDAAAMAADCALEADPAASKSVVAE